MSPLWLMVSVGGPILLAAALAYTIIRNWRENPQDGMRRDEPGRRDERRDGNETFI